MSAFAITVVVTFIGVFIYLKLCAKPEVNIEEDQDYKDVGGIVKEDKGKEKNNMNTDEGVINEEEE